MPCSLVERHAFKEPASSIFCPEDWCSTVLRNPGNDQAWYSKATDILELETTHQIGQTPDKEVEIQNINVYISGYTETHTTVLLFPTTDGEYFKPSKILREFLDKLREYDRTNIEILISLWIVWKTICTVILISESALKQKRNLLLLFGTYSKFW